MTFIAARVVPRCSVNSVSATDNIHNRAFVSQLRRLKSYLRLTMTQARLNHIAILNCLKDFLKQINVDDVADDFIVRNRIRRNTFALKQQHN